MMGRPLIGVTKPADGDNLAFLAIVAAVRLAGGRVKKLTTGMSWRDAKIDGLVIGGGSDVFPPHYDQSAIEGADYDESRDEMEMYWARKTRDRDVPTLAICRGAQVMNVASGGSLHQSLEGFYDDVDYPSTVRGQIFYRKTINIVPQSLLARITQHTLTRVNSIHKQAIARVGDGLHVTASERNGVVQAIEDPEKAYYLGVQFHPEFLIHRKQFRAIFRALVEAAKTPLSSGSSIPA